MRPESRRGRPRKEQLTGLGDRLLHDALKANGHQDLAKQLNPVVAKSRKDRLGMIVLRPHSGADNSVATRVARDFEEKIGGSEGLLAPLEAIGTEALPEGIRNLPTILRDPANTGKRLYRILAENKLSLLSVMKAYTKGCVELAQVEAAIEAYRGMPKVVRDLLRHAIDRDATCPTCLGMKLVKRKSTDKKETIPCPTCSAEGIVQVSSDHKEFAAKTILEITKQVGAPGKTEVNVAVGINMATGKSYAERMVDAADRILYGREVIDVEGRAVEDEGEVGRDPAGSAGGGPPGSDGGGSADVHPGADTPA